MRKKKKNVAHISRRQHTHKDSHGSSDESSITFVGFCLAIIGSISFLCGLIVEPWYTQLIRTKYRHNIFNMRVITKFRYNWMEFLKLLEYLLTNTHPQRSLEESYICQQKSQWEGRVRGEGSGTACDLLNARFHFWLNGGFWYYFPRHSTPTKQCVAKTSSRVFFF